MIPPKTIFILLSVAFLIHYVTSAKQAVVSKKSKLCGNVACEEVLFKSRVKRVMGVNNDPSFLNLVENSYISVVAVKFSDRPDIMEGKLNNEGPTGFFYAGAIELMPFAEFLRTAIEEKKEMLMISQNGADVGDKRIVGVVHSETDLVRDYNAKSAQAAAEMGLPAPEPMAIPEPTGGHGHSHGGHGHSHGGHGHSHGGHGHSHGHPAPTPAPTPIPEALPVTTPAPTEAAPVPVETAPEVTTPVPEEVKPEINLNNVLGSPPTLNSEEKMEKIELSEMDAEIERMIRDEEERLAKAKAESQKDEQPPLVLSSLPAEPIVEAVTVAPVPEVIPEALPVASETTTTPAPPVAPVEAAPEAPKVPEQVQEIVAESVTLPPVVETPEPTPDQEPIAQYIPPVVEAVTPAPEALASAQEELTTPAPATPLVDELPQVVTTPPTPPAAQETGVCYKDECHGLQDQSQEAIKAAELSPEEQDFLKWEEERKKRDVKPYEDAQASHHFRDLPVIPPKSAGIIDFIRSTFGLGNITDASVILYLNLTFLVASLVFYLIMRTLSSGGGDSDTFDRQAYFNLVTKHKELQLQLQAKQSEVQSLQHAGAPQQQVPNHEPELIALRQQVSQLHTDLQIAHSQRQDFELHCGQLREISEQKEQQIGELNVQMNEYKERLERSASEVQEWARQLDAVRAELNESQQAAYSRQQELVTQQQEHDSTQDRIQELTSDARILQTRIVQLEQANEELEIELKDLKLVNDGLHDNVQHLEKQLEKSQNESGSAAESGGSGWSDFGDVDEVEEKKEEKTPDASHSELADYRAKYKKYGEDMEELAALKIKLDEIEKELAKYKDVERKLRNAEADVADAKRKIEEITAEKKELGDRLNETVKTLNNTINKSSDTDKVIATLREDGYSKDKKLLEVEGELRKKDDKIREIEAEFNQYKRNYVKLETKSFHDHMILKKELDDIKSERALGSQNFSRDMFESRKSADRNLAASPLDNPIWDEPEFAPKMAPLQNEDYYSSGSNTMPSKRRSSRRSDHRLLAGAGEMSPSDQEHKIKKEHRRRSRSQGRQVPVYHDPYALNQFIPGSSDSSFLSQGFQPLSGRHSKSGQHLVYSSGGSNGGRSPPPEMPLLSAIPPPGARKPASKRADPTLYGPK